MTATSSHAQEEISIERRSVGFALVKSNNTGQKEEIKLTENEILFLSRMLPETIRKITSSKIDDSMAQQGVSSTPAVPVLDVILNTDLHNRFVLATIIDKFSNEMGFAFDNELARAFGEALLSWADKLEKPIK